MIIEKFKEEYIHELTTFIHHTIKTCFPAIYSLQAIQYYLNYHSKDELLRISKEGHTYLFIEKNKIVASGNLLQEVINAVYVLPELQGKGYGTKMVKYLIKKAREFEFKEIYIEATPLAQSFYQALGFKLENETSMLVDDMYPLAYSEMILKLNPE